MDNTTYMVLDSDKMDGSTFIHHSVCGDSIPAGNTGILSELVEFAEAHTKVCPALT